MRQKSEAYNPDSISHCEITSEINGLGSISNQEMRLMKFVTGTANASVYTTY